MRPRRKNCRLESPSSSNRARDLDNHESHFLELEQSFSHALELSPCPPEGDIEAWGHYRLGGSYEKVVMGALRPYPLLTIKSSYLELYLHVSKSRLLRVFDFPRVTDSFTGWAGPANAQSRLSFDANPIYARHHAQANAAFIRGFQIFDRFEDEDKAQQIYESHW